MSVRILSKRLNFSRRKDVYYFLCSRFKHCNIAINGGGLVGTAMACSIARSPQLAEKSVIVFEAFKKNDVPKKSVNDEYSNRVSSLNPGTRQLFEKLGVWNYISDVRYKAVKKMQVWDACSDAVITFNDDLINDVSYIVENDVILYALKEALNHAKGNVITEYETKIKSISLPSSDKTVIFETETGEKYTCNILIGADGAKSQTRATIGKQYLEWDYNQMGIVATMKLAEATENNVAWQRFLPSGPVALLPLNNELSSLVWSTTTEEAKELMKLSDESFVDAVNDAFWKTYPKNEVVKRASDAVTKTLDYLNLNSGVVRQLPPSVEKLQPKSRAAFPLGFGHATQYIASGIALIGDAAHRVHPLAGQGVNLGFGDVKCLTEILSDAVYSGDPIGSERVLKRYQSERLTHNVPIMMAIDMLQKLYGTSFTPAVLLRTLGLQITHALDPLKNAIMQYASR